MRSSQILHIFVLRAVKVTIFVPRVAIFTAPETNVYKICELRTATFSTFSNISRPNLAVLLIQRCSFQLRVVLDFVLFAGTKSSLQLEQSIVVEVFWQTEKDYGIPVRRKFCHDT